MGYNRAHAILVTHNYNADELEQVREALSRFVGSSLLSPVMHHAVNGGGTFLVAPDGSKEGWPESEAGDRLRDLVINHLESYRYADGSTGIHYIEVMYADDNDEAAIVRHDGQEPSPNVLGALPQGETS